MKTCIIIILIILLWQASVADEYAGIKVFRYDGSQAPDIALTESTKSVAGPNVGFDFKGGLAGSSKESGLAVNAISSNLNSIINSRFSLNSFEFDTPKMTEFKDSMEILILNSETGAFVSEDTSHLALPMQAPDPAKEVNAMFNLILPVEETIPDDTATTEPAETAVENPIPVENAIADDDTVPDGNTVPVEDPSGDEAAPTSPEDAQQ
jgi:hypothetical protein